MSYLTLNEYEQLTGSILSNSNLSSEVEFERLLVKASNELDVLTRFYFRKHPLNDGIIDRQFKLALAYQIDFYVMKDATTLEEIESQPDSVSIGDTRIDYNRTLVSASAKQRSSSISKDALNALAGTGLLYRGSGGYEF